MDRGNKKTEQWILQQQMFLEAENAKHHAAARESTAQQEIWKETVYSYETKTERWMKHKEEARRRAGEKERKTRLIDEEIRRIETRMRIRREEERQKIAEERRKMQKERDRRNRLKAEKAVLEAWRGYEERWSKLITSSEALKFSSIPWPVVSVPGKAEDMTPQGVVAFLFSYLHSEKQTRKERLRSAQLRWHPDRFQRVLARVKDEDKAEVEQAVGIVARCLNDIKLRTRQLFAAMLSRLTRLPLRRCLHTAPPRTSRSLSRSYLTLGASATVATYLAFRLTSHSHSIALDSEHLETQSATLSPSEPSIRPSSEKPASAVSTTGESDTSADTPPTTSQGESEKAASEGESQEGGGSGGAFNPVTGEINWDCPCLGGMAHGPCGPQFREAFSCFVFSEDEPKGINCVEKFKAMQNCFREHPEIYADEIDDDDEAAPEPTATQSVSNETLSEPAPQTAISKPQDSQPSETLA
ncbi:hypothetical protein C0995_007473 [Termitomyces sp. Mi166|nr:hypothetical protein C0995_007473 [Termitomyces sp. Mi166\